MTDNPRTELGEPILNATFLFGEKKFVPPTYSLTSEMHGPWWWRQPAYYIDCDTGSRLGPFYEKREAIEQLAFVNSVRDPS